MNELPINRILPDVMHQIGLHKRLVIQAPPGAGKSTQLPLAFIGQAFQGCIWLLEPRRLAAEQVAHRLAASLNQNVGESIGLITGERRKLSDKNQIIVMTEAILSQRLIKENDIPDCAMVIFDEFHERNLETDLGLALVLQCQEYLRDDLRLIIMSATLDSEHLAQRLDCPIISSDGRSFDVDVHYLPKHEATYLSQAVKSAVQLVFNQQDTQTNNDILIFLPGMKEIQQCQRLLNETFERQLSSKQLSIEALHAQLSAEQQQNVIASGGPQKIILATDIAKTSLTLPRVSVVIDSGLERINQFNVRQGMDELVTVKASQASAIQRAGRAGRVQAGRCYRLYSEEDFQCRPAFSTYAIERSDLAPLCLNLAAWGSLDVSDYEFLTPPDPTRMGHSIELLQNLNALNQDAITDHGQTLALFGVHPRLSHMMMHGQAWHLGFTACTLAALLSEGDPLVFDEPNSDLTLRMQLFEQSHLPAFFEGAKVNQHLAKRIQRQAKKYAALLRIQPENIQIDATHKLLMLAYPDRIAQKRGKGYRLRSGQGCQLHDLDHLTQQDWLAVCFIQQSQQAGQHARSIIRLACPTDRQTIETLFKDELCTTTYLQLNDKNQLNEISQEKLGELVIKETSQPAQASARQEYDLQQFKQLGLSYLPLGDSHKNTLSRLQLAHALFANEFMSFTEQDLIADAENWLAPFLATSGLKQVDFQQAFLSRLEWPVQQQLNHLFPLSFELPVGRHASIDYTQSPPVIKAKLQECFGLAQSPTIANGKVTLNLHLLSPAQRPLAMTQDLAFFWKEAYPQVRKENRGRYAKHPWPEDPLSAQASSHTKRYTEHNSK